MEAVYCSETSISAYVTTQCHTPQYQNLNNHQHENLRTYIRRPASSIKDHAMKMHGGVEV
jgi:hypothetical protein